MAREKQGHGTTEGAERFVGGTHKDPLPFARHRLTCDGSRSCEERVEAAEAGLASSAVVQLVTAFLRTQDRRAKRGGTGCFKIEDILELNSDDPNLKEHIATCPFCRAIFEGYVASPEVVADSEKVDEEQGSGGEEQEPEFAASAKATGEKAEADATDDSGSLAERGGAPVGATEGTETEEGPGS